MADHPHSAAKSPESIDDSPPDRSASSKPDTSPSVISSDNAGTDTSVGGVRSSTESAGSEGLPFSVLGHYEVVCAIGRGGMGDVYRGYERALDRSVALKVLPAEFSGEPEFVRRFYAEATAAARVIHPHVIPIHFIGEDAGRHFFAMQYVEGESLASLLARRGRLSVGETLDLLEQVLSGLSAAHQQGLIHRDIKPGNILLDRVHQRAVLADFGLVKSLASVDGRTATGVVMGTADYIAPEQGRGQPVDHRCDLYAVGVLAYQLLSGKLPFAGDSPTAVIFQHVYERPNPLSDAVRDLPAALDAVVAKLLAKSSESRHATADAVLADLQAIRTGSPLPSGADRELAANPHAFMVGVPRANSRTAQTKVIRAPLLADEAPWPIVEPAARRMWWHRAKSWWDDWLRSKTPQWVQQLQSTQQQVEGGVAEYERRRDRLRRLVAEGDEVLATLQAAVAQASDSTELRQTVADQEEQLATMRLQLAQDEARLRQLVNQRDLLQARLKAAYARQHVEGKRPPFGRTGQRLMMTAAVVGVGVPVVVIATKLRAPHAVVTQQPAIQNPPQTNDSKPKMTDSKPNVPLLTDVLELTKGRQVEVNGVQNLVFGRKNRPTAIVNSHGAIELRDPDNFQLIKAIDTTAAKPGNVMISSDGTYAAVVFANHIEAKPKLVVWDLGQEDAAVISTNLEQPVQMLGFAGTPPHLILQTTNAPRQIIRWPVEANTQPLHGAGGIAIDGHFVVDPKGNQFAIRQSDKVVLLTFADPIDVPPTIQSIPLRATSLAFHPRDGSLAIGAEDGSVTVWDASSHRGLYQLDGPTSAIRALAFDDRGRWLAVSDSKSVRIWDMGLMFVRGVIPREGVTSLFFAAKGQQLATVATADQLQIWDTDFQLLEVDFESWAKSLLPEQVSRLYPSQAIAKFDPREATTSDGRLTVVTPPDAMPFVKDTLTGNDVFRLQNARPSICAAVSPDQRLAAIGSWNRERGNGDVRTWDLSDGREVGDFVGHVHYAWALAFSSDSRRLLSGGRNTMHLWDVASQRELLRIKVPFDSVRRITFSPDDRQAVASEYEYEDRASNHILFDLATGNPLLRLKAVSPHIVFAGSHLFCDQRFGTARRIGD